MAKSEKITAVNLFDGIPTVQAPIVEAEKITASNLFEGIPTVSKPDSDPDTELEAMWSANSEELGETSAFETYMKQAVTEWANAAKLGYQESITGMINRRKESDKDLKLDRMSLMQTFFYGLGQSFDIPYYLTGYMLGGGNPISGGGGAMALPTGIKKVYIDRLRKGKVTDTRDFAIRSCDALKDTAKAWLVGGSGVGAGGASQKLIELGGRVPLEVITMTAVSSALEGQLPSGKDFADTAMTILAFHAGSAIAKSPQRATEKIIVDAVKKRNASDVQNVQDRLMDHYVKTGELPGEAMLKAQKDQVFAQELLAVNKLKTFPDVVTSREHAKKMGELFNTTELSKIHDKASKLSQELSREGFDSKPMNMAKLNESQKVGLKAQGSREAMEEQYRVATGEKNINKEKFEEWKASQVEGIGERIATPIEQAGGKKSIKQKIDNGITEIVTGITNNLHPLQLMTERLVGGKKNARLLDVIHHPAKLAQLSRGLAGKMTHYYEHGGWDVNTLKTTTRGMKPILESVHKISGLKGKASQAEFTQYIVAKHARELEARGIKTGMEHIDKSFTKKLDAKYEKYLLELVDLQNSAFKQLHDVGIVSDLAWKNTKLRQQLGLDKFHVPFKRLVGKEGTPFELSGGLTAKNPLKARKGGGQKILDPLESIQLDIMGKLQAVENQRIAQSIVELTKAFDIGKNLIKESSIAKELTPKELTKILESKDGSDFFSTNVDSIAYFKNGKRLEFTIDAEIANLVKNIGVEKMPFYVPILAPFASTLRAGATLIADFAIKNVVRDSVMSYVNTKNNIAPRLGIDILGEMFKRSKKTDRYKEFLKAGGANSTLISIDRPTIRKQTMNDLRRTKFHNVIAKLGPLKVMRDFSEHMETATRLAEFKLTKRRMEKAGNTGYRGMAQAGFEAREITLDFARTGAATKKAGINNISAFFNATVQGHSKIFRTLSENPGVSALKISMAVVVPSIIVALANQGDDDIKQVSKVQRDLFWVFKFGNSIIRVPKPHEIGAAGSIVERGMAYLLDDDPHAFDDIISSLGGTMMPNLMPTALLPLIEAKFNHSFFRDRKLVSASNERRLAEYQYTMHTTELAKSVAQMIAQVPGSHIMDEFRSPIAIENYVQAWTGGLGKHTLWATNQLLIKAGIFDPAPKPTVKWTEHPMVQSFFVRNPSMSAESISTFYHNWEEGQKIAQTISGLKKEINYDDIPMLLGQSDFNALSSFKEALSNLTTERRMIMRLSSLEGKTKDELRDWKREQMDIIIRSSIEVAKAGNDLYVQIMDFQRSNKETRSLFLDGK